MIQIVGIIAIIGLIAVLVVMRKKDAAGTKTTKSSRRLASERSARRGQRLPARVQEAPRRPVRSEIPG